MALPHIFGNLSGSAPTSYLDDNFNAVAKTGVIPCIATGSNIIVLTIASSNFAPTSYSNYLMFGFEAVGTSTGPVTIQVGSLAALNAYQRLRNVALRQANAGDITLGHFYIAVFDSALNGGAGGFHLFGESIAKAPTTTVFLSGSGTYTTPAGATRLYIRMIGGAGGGAGSGTTPGAATGNANTTFGTLTSKGGAPGTQAGFASGGISTGGDWSVPGGSGGASSGATSSPGGAGGISFLGAAGPGGGINDVGLDAQVNSGSGGGGAGSGSTGPTGGGGAAGGYQEASIASPAATYSYAVGAGGTAGTAGTGGKAGGVGGSGRIIIVEYYD